MSTMVFGLMRHKKTKTVVPSTVTSSAWTESTSYFDPPLEYYMKHANAYIATETPDTRSFISNEEIEEDTNRFRQVGKNNSINM